MLSGPNQAEEVLQGLPGATVIASDDEQLALRLQDAVNSSLFRVYVNSDVVGVELCGAAKNVIALAAGAVDGLGLGDNAKAGAHHARPRRDGAARRGVRSVVGDVRRPRRDGRPDGHVLPPERSQPPGRRADRTRRDADEARAEIGQVVEGLTTAPVLRELSHRIGVELPITEGVCSVLDGRPLHELAAGLMGRRPTEE